MAVTLEVFGIRAGSVGCAAGYEPACTNLISASLFQAGPLTNNLLVLAHFGCA